QIAGAPSTHRPLALAQQGAAPGQSLNLSFSSRRSSASRAAPPLHAAPTTSEPPSRRPSIPPLPLPLQAAADPARLSVRQLQASVREEKPHPPNSMDSVSVSSRRQPIHVASMGAPSDGAAFSGIEI